MEICKEILGRMFCLRSYAYALKKLVLFKTSSSDPYGEYSCKFKALFQVLLLPAAIYSALFCLLLILLLLGFLAAFLYGGSDLLWQSMLECRKVIMQ